MGILRVLVVPGYGCILTQELKKYLNQVIVWIDEWRPNIVLFSGGFTQRQKAPGVSEAALMREYVLGHVSYTDFTVAVDEYSYTTLDNIQNATELMASLHYAGEEGGGGIEVQIFSEANRRFKVGVLARLAMLSRVKKIEVKSVAWEHGLIPKLKQVISTFAELAAFFIPSLARRFCESRIRRAEHI